MLTQPIEFEDLLRTHKQMVFNTAFRLLANVAEAEDISQEVFLLLWKHFPDKVEPKTTSGWLKVVTRNLCLNHLQRYRARWVTFTDLSYEDCEGGRRTLEFVDSKNTDTAGFAADQHELIARLLATLTADQRAVFQLCHFEDLDYAEVALRLKVSLGKIKTDAFRARATLRKRLQSTRDFMNNGFLTRRTNQRQKPIKPIVVAA